MKELINHYPPCPLAGGVIFFRLVVWPTAFLLQQVLCVSSQVLGRSWGSFPTSVLWLLVSFLLSVGSHHPKHPTGSIPVVPLAPCLPTAIPGKVLPELAPRDEPRCPCSLNCIPQLLYIHQSKGKKCLLFGCLSWLPLLKEDDIYWWKTSQQTHQLGAIYHRSPYPQVTDNSALFPLLRCSALCASKLSENRYWSKTLRRPSLLSSSVPSFFLRIWKYRKAGSAQAEPGLNLGRCRNGSVCPSWIRPGQFFWRLTGMKHFLSAKVYFLLLSHSQLD